MKKSSTMFLRVAVVLISLVVLAVCALVLPAGIRSGEAGPLEPLLWGMYVPAVPFFVAVYHTFKLLGNIDHGRAFSEASVRSLNVIKYCAIAIGGLYFAVLPIFYMIAENGDAPGVMLIGLVLAFGPMAVAVLAAVLQKLFQNALEIKSENELTV